MLTSYFVKACDSYVWYEETLVNFKKMADAKRSGAKWEEHKTQINKKDSRSRVRGRTQLWRPT